MHPIRFPFCASALFSLGACHLAGPATTPAPVSIPGPAAASATPSAPASPPAAQAPETLADFLALALDQSPGLRAAHARWEAAAEEVGLQTALADPVLRARWFLEEVETRVGPQEWAVSISQALPWFGTRRRAGDAAEARARVEEARYGEQVLALFADVKVAWAELYLLERSIATVRENRDGMTEIEEVVRSRFRSGDGSYADVLRVQVELGRLDDRLASLEDRRRPLGARLNALVHRPAGAPLPRELELPAEGLLLEEERLRALHETASPRLNTLRLAVDAAERGTAVAEVARRPTVTLGAEYIQTGGAISPGVPGSGDDPILATVGLNLPLVGRRYHAMQRRAQAHERAARADLALGQDQAAAELEHELFAVRDAERQVELYRDTLVPRARQAYRVTDTAFRAGELTFGELIDAERALLEFELALEGARTARAQALARLERLVGAPVTTSPTEGDPR